MATPLGEKDFMVYEGPAESTEKRVTERVPRPAPTFSSPMAPLSVTRSHCSLTYFISAVSISLQTVNHKWDTPYEDIMHVSPSWSELISSRCFVTPGATFSLRLP